MVKEIRGERVKIKFHSKCVAIKSSAKYFHLAHVQLEEAFESTLGITTCKPQFFSVPINSSSTQGRNGNVGPK
ncbi:hypothetical protein CEXT_191531 [Caerostris extrusa]|uniref:Uncharacterized protein n=1 Tax=Caerostris extrusa TaxID=172846 RepID=A0AAV4U1K5_CAEEX|nr:hypothetical protein CEXT_191531 [Caerostris extrusa]